MAKLQINHLTRINNIFIQIYSRIFRYSITIIVSYIIIYSQNTIGIDPAIASNLVIGYVNRIHWDSTYLVMLCYSKSLKNWLSTKLARFFYKFLFSSNFWAIYMMIFQSGAANNDGYISTSSTYYCITLTNQLKTVPKNNLNLVPKNNFRLTDPSLYHCSIIQ